MTRFREIERLRGLAILLAVFNHEPLHQLVPWFTGVIGVELFFVISGFVITLSLLRLRQAASRPFATFYLRRAFRLLPMAVVSIGVALAASAWFNTVPAWNPPARVARQAVAALTLTHNYRVFDLGWDLVYFWSLNVEEHFYLVLPLVLLAAARRWRWTFGQLLAGFSAAWLVAVAVRVTTAPGGPYDIVAFWSNHFSTHAQLDFLLAGVLVGLCHHVGVFERPSASREMRIAATLVATAATWGLVFVHSIFTWDSQLGWTMVEACSVVLVWLASFRRGYVLRAPILSELLEYLGARAYVIYLLHMGCWRLIAEFLHRAAGVEQALGTAGVDLVYAALVLVFAEICHHSVEKPFIRLGQRLTRSSPNSPGVAQVRAA